MPIVCLCSCVREFVCVCARVCVCVYSRHRTYLLGHKRPASTPRVSTKRPGCYFYCYTIKGLRSTEIRRYFDFVNGKPQPDLLALFAFAVTISGISSLARSLSPQAAHMRTRVLLLLKPRTASTPLS